MSTTDYVTISLIALLFVTLLVALLVFVVGMYYCCTRRYR